MSELLPTLQADDIQRGLVDYLATTFALADADARRALEAFLRDPVDGIFKGPYVRLRVPFRTAGGDWRQSLEWYDDHGFIPYGHQAVAFARLSTANLTVQKPAPLPTLVTTGTGSGKTEAFLYPILDHVQRTKRAGQGGIKALILYPMNALANDQARRLAEIITTNSALSGVRAAIYTGQEHVKRTDVTPDGLINDRAAMRAEAPDLLLTNYKMLDRLLLRPADQPLWQQSAKSLQYLVLDEFHTYDGAQGTDVAMLLRRLGLAVSRNGGDPTRITPVATSATLGDQNDPSSMIAFANTVFGERFDASAVVTETRLSAREWIGDAPARVAARGFRPRAVDVLLVERVNGLVEEQVKGARDSAAITHAVIGALYADAAGEPPAFEPSDHLDLLRAHPITEALIEQTGNAIALDELADLLIPAGLGATETYEARRGSRVNFAAALIAALSHVRAVEGRAALSIDLHLWMRALTRIDRAATPEVTLSWSDDGFRVGVDGDETPAQFPAIFCRHCGRSGWGIELEPTGTTLAPMDTPIRANHASHANSRFRALLYAPAEAARAAEAPAGSTDRDLDGLRWLNVREWLIEPNSDGAETTATRIPVLMVTGDDIGERSDNDECPSCQRRDGIRFLGSAVATMLSVAVTTMFADHALDTNEKKALVFTDSVQDAAHRAGFVQSRSHVFGLRNAIRHAVGNRTMGLDTLVEELLHRAETPVERFRLLAPDIAERPEFEQFWSTPRAIDVPAKVRRRVRDRLLLDVELEFGLQSRVGRTLELTGTLAAEVDAGSPAKLASIGARVVKGYTRQAELGEDSDADGATDRQLVQWVRGVLERMRERGAIEHRWFTKYIQSDGRRWAVWGGRPRGVGMPAFPRGRDAPGYPRVGGNAPVGTDAQRTHLDVAGTPQSWFTIWAKQVLGVTAPDGAKLTRALLVELERVGLVTGVEINSGSTAVYQIDPALITVTPVREEDRQARRHLLVCDVCRSPIPGTVTVIDQLEGAPCMASRCPGRLRRERRQGGYYLRLYEEGDMRSVVAREHSSLLTDEVRLRYEQGFKASAMRPDTPNVLVATPTLEMGIDIGDLSSVMLAGLPKTVASYLQRVGRAGRLTGNALSLAFVEGRGDQLPKVGEPLSVINGQVRAPATYLDAEEILQRQFIAYLCDRQASLAEKQPRIARDVLATAEPGTFLDRVIEDAEAGPERVSEFLAEFHTLAPWARDGLRAWSVPSSGPRTSGFAADVFGAVQRWNDERELLFRRRTEIEDGLPALQREAEHPATKDDEEVKARLRSAQSALKMTGALIRAHTNDPWISALERAGLLPNYTLLDDTVELNVSLTWFDEETNAWEHGAESFDRGAASAISELAPGAMFYARGLEMKVDAVDLGVEGAAVQRWVFCPECGYSEQLVGSIAAPTQCPRCLAKGIADAAQQFDVVELRRAYAEVRKDEASINDARDERQREPFTIKVAADIDPQNVIRRWYVGQSGFGVSYLRSLTIRWLNMGHRSQHGQSRLLAGEDVNAPLFRVCEACGKLDTSTNANSAREHRAWCRLRNAREEQVRTIALSRTLRTQGLVMRMPPSLTVGDSFAVPSFSAAVQLGLREIIGGDPDHLRIERIVDPVQGEDTNVPALLIHDTVPGGTGYLADMAVPDRVRELFQAALKIVADCQCQHEGRAACHLCLLPYAPGGHADLVSRASAERALRDLLGEGTWDVSEGAAPVVESSLEAYFRKVFIGRAKSLGAAVKELPGETGNRVQVTLGNRTWLLRPQVALGATKPDFVLEPFGGGVPPLAIYTDGFAYHASVQVNVLREDAKKRQALRDLGYRVMAITWDDLKRAESGDPEPDVDWFDPTFAANFTSSYGLALSWLDRVTANPITELMGWIQRPGQADDQWQAVGRALPTMAMQPAGQFIDLPESGLESVLRQVLSGTAPGVENPTRAWVVNKGPLVWASQLIDDVETTTMLVLDDRESALRDEDFVHSWRLWLRLSNLLGQRGAVNKAIITTASGLADEVGITHAAATAPEVPPHWSGAVDMAFGRERDLLIELAKTDAPIPSIGEEVGDGIPVGISWPDLRIAARIHLNDADIAELAREGWTLVEPDLHHIMTALDAAQKERD
ncbi:DEAD/DEAH box helicase [Microbacterium luticocti]|uniref:DEAD/DEAH box helicase n=1 Tax=Microbacterium luticocti TaxID=451764 RepID=UPI0004057A1A|nr:DEAD/DEAH box helicase [Microbacterium luticocti]